MPVSSPSSTASPPSSPEEGLIPAILQTPDVWARRLAYATATGVFLGVVGAFGTFQAAPLVNRVAAWVLMVWIGTLVFPALATATIILGRRLRTPLWIALPLAIAIGGVPMTLGAELVTGWLIHPHGPWRGLQTYVQVIVVALPVVGAYVALRRRQPLGAAAPEPVPAPTAPSKPAPALLARLPARLGRDLLCLEMEDHYVRVHTALGSELLLMRMRDAIALLDGLEGLQVHRSWWVAADAVEGQRTVDRRTVLKLRGGLEAPVARGNVQAVRAAGWLR